MNSFDKVELNTSNESFNLEIAYNGLGLKPNPDAVSAKGFGHSANLSPISRFPAIQFTISSKVGA